MRHTANSGNTRRGIRLSHLSWLVIAAAAVTGELVIQAEHHDPMEQFAAPVRNIPAFNVLSAADVRPLWRPARQIPRGAILSSSAVIGHVTMSPLWENQPISGSELGPLVPGRNGRLTIVGVPATAAMALNGKLPAGQEIGVVVGRRHRLTRVLVLAVTRSGTGSRPYVVLVAVPAHTRRDVIAALGAGTVTLVSEPMS